PGQVKILPCRTWQTTASSRRQVQSVQAGGRNKRLDAAAECLDQLRLPRRIELRQHVVQKKQRVFPDFFADKFQFRQLEGQGGGSLLTLRTIGLGVPPVDEQPHIVPVRTDQRDAAAKLLFLALC